MYDICLSYIVNNISNLINLINDVHDLEIKIKIKLFMNACSVVTIDSEVIFWT